MRQHTLTFSRESGDLPWPQSEADLGPSASQKSTPTRARFSKRTGPISRTLEMFLELDQASYLKDLTCSPLVSHAKIYPGTVKERGSKANALDYGAKSFVSLESYSPILYSLKTSLLSSVEALTNAKWTWKESATPANHLWLELKPSKAATKETGSGLLPTLRASEWKGCGPKGSKSHHHWLKRFYLSAHTTESGKLNPMFAERMMGYPTGHTALNASETQSYQESRKSSLKQSGTK